MSGDYSRFTFKPGKRFSSVQMQQGRVQLDADWNEEIDILKRRWEIQATDTFGHAAVPRKTTPDGFKVTSLSPLTVGKGRMYVDGLLAERLDTDPQHSNLVLSPQPVPPGPGKQAVVYLDVWEREVTYIEDPDLLEPALGGPDTATRTQVVWQVKVQEVASAYCEYDLSQIVQPSAGRLTSQGTAPPASTDPCVLPPTGNYRGLENRLYRVEIHKGGAIGTATYKWSRENASIVSRVTEIVGDKIKVTRIGRDKVLRFQRGDWVEILDDMLELKGEPGFIARIAAPPDEATLTIKLDRAVPAGLFDPTQLERHTRVRRWDHRKDETKTELPDGSQGVLTTNGAFVELEDGIEVKITAQSGGKLKTGDAWCFAARAVDGSVEELTDEPPRAIQHHYVQLAYWDGKPHDCRPLWPDEQCCCCTVEVGDGVTSHGDFDELEEAMRETYRRTPAGVPIRFCLLPGTHRLPTIVLDRNLVTISGCGRATVVEAPRTGPAFQLNAETLRLENLYLKSSFDEPHPLVEVVSAIDVTIVDNLFEAPYRGLLAIEDVRALNVFDNIFVGNGLRARGSGMLIARNYFIGIEAMRAAPGLLQLQSPAWRIRVIGNRLADGREHGILLYQDAGSALSDIVIAHNDILGMWGSGIATAFFSDRGTAGGVSGDPTSAPGTTPVYVHDLGIVGNKIVECIPFNTWKRNDGAPQGGIVIGGIEHLLIADNCIHRNGTAATVTPVAGIYVGNAEGLIVRDNVVTDNGPAPSGEVSDRSEGGIVARSLADGNDGWPAASVHGNLVSAPHRALTLLGTGRMHVTDNQLVSVELNPQRDPGDIHHEDYTGAALIRNESLPMFRPLPVPAFETDVARFSWWNVWYVFLPGASVELSDNQISLSRVVNGQLGHVVQVRARSCDVGFQGNQVTCDSGIASLDSTVRTESITVRATGNGVFEKEFAADIFYSMEVEGSSLANGTNNQATHCIRVQGGSVINSPNQSFHCPQINTITLDAGDVSLLRKTAVQGDLARLRQRKAALAGSGTSADPALQSLDRQILEAERTAELAEVDLRMSERMKKEVQPGDWTVVGRLLDAQGKPVSGARLEISEGTKKLSEIPADDKGELFAHYSGEKFKDLFARKPQLKLTIKSADGKVLQTLDRTFVPVSDRVAALELRIGQSEATLPPQAGDAKKPPSKRKPARRKPAKKGPKAGPSKR